MNTLFILLLIVLAVIFLPSLSKSAPPVQPPVPPPPPPPSPGSFPDPPVKCPPHLSHTDQCCQVGRENCTGLSGICPPNRHNMPHTKCPVSRESYYAPPPPTPQGSCGDTRRCVQSTSDAVNPALCSSSSSDCTSCLSNKVVDTDMYVSVTKDCAGNSVDRMKTWENQCFNQSCLDALRRYPKLDPTNPLECTQTAKVPAVASDLQRAGCLKHDINSYCAGQVVGRAGCEAQNQKYDSDGYKYWKRPYGSGNATDGWQFGANCPPAVQGSVVNIKGTDYAMCAPRGQGIENKQCPPAPNGKHGFVAFNDFEGHPQCVLGCADVNDCPGGQECISVQGTKFCAGKINSQNTFHSNPTVKYLFSKSKCHAVDNCPACVLAGAPAGVVENLTQSQLDIFCNEGQFLKEILPSS